MGNFIITKDETVALELKRNGFILLNEENEQWTFLNEPNIKMTFSNKKVIYTDTLCI